MRIELSMSELSKAAVVAVRERFPHLVVQGTKYKVTFEIDGSDVRALVDVIEK